MTALGTEDQVTGRQKFSNPVVAGFPIGLFRSLNPT
jgi:hypothetical protein